MPAADFTPAPWQFQLGIKPPHHLSIHGNRGQSICTIWTQDEAIRRRNAQLIVTAPELYAGLDLMLDLISELEVDGLHLNADQLAKLRTAEAALEKANKP